MATTGRKDDRNESRRVSASRTAMRRATTLVTLAALLTGCQPDQGMPGPDNPGVEPAAQAIPEAECDWRSALTEVDALQTNPPCAIEFREVTRLTGDLNGIIPREPITILADGTFLTATYAQGRLARWSADGEFMFEMGNGPGNGPGEFNYATGLAPLNGDEVIVFTGGRTIHWYSTGGDFLRSVLLPPFGGAPDAVVHGGAAIFGTTAAVGREGYALEGDDVRSLGPVFGSFGRNRKPIVLTAAKDLGIWSAVYDRYVLRRHVWPAGTIADSVIVDRDWFPGPAGAESNLFDLHADGHGLIWVPLSVEDPEAPGRPRSQAGEGSGMTMAEMAEWTETYRDVVIEALTPKGDVVASTRFESYSDAAEPIQGNLWYRASEDELSIIILEALLVDRGQGAAAAILYLCRLRSSES